MEAFAQDRHLKVEAYQLENGSLNLKTEGLNGLKAYLLQLR